VPAFLRKSAAYCTLSKPSDQRADRRRWLHRKRLNKSARCFEQGIPGLWGAHKLRIRAYGKRFPPRESRLVRHKIRHGPRRNHRCQQVFLICSIGNNDLTMRDQIRLALDARQRLKASIQQGSARGICPTSANISGDKHWHGGSGVLTRLMSCGQRTPGRKNASSQMGHW
jgi:hypothetical protein